MDNHRLFTNIKLKITGDKLVYTQYEKDFAVGPNPYARNKRPRDPNKPKTFRRYIIRKAKQTVVDLINTNCNAYINPKTKKSFAPTFATFTFAQNLQDIPQAKKLFRDFIRRLSRNITDDASQQSYLQYLGVIEFQRRGAIHFHVVFFNLPYIWNGLLQEIWSHGYTDIRLIEDIQNIGAYIAKYIGKDMGDPRLYDQPSYFRSRGLKEPLKVYGATIPDYLIANLPLEAMTQQKCNFPTGYLGNADQMTFDLRDFPEDRKMLDYLISKTLITEG